MFLYNVEIADRCGVFLSRLRTNAGISRRKMSESIDVSESTIKLWEAGQGSPTLTVILEWFRVAGENPFSYLLEFFWPDTFGNLCIKSTDEELRKCLSVYLQQVAGEQEIRQLHYLILERSSEEWSGVLDMFCAHAHTSLKSRYKISEIIQTSYELSLANNIALKTNLFNANEPLVRYAITAARDAMLSHKQGYSVYLNRNCQPQVSAILKKSRTDAKVELSYLAKAMGKTERTLKNWEQNTEPSFLDLCIWFHILEKPIWDYLRSEMLTKETVSPDESIIKQREELQQYFCKMDRSELRRLCFLIFWKHGSNWHSLLELMIAHVSSPLYHRVISARSVLVGYEIDSNEARLYAPIGVLPDIENLKQRIELGTQIAKAGKLSF